nr:response regulator [uncultured Halomonas sp.]
MQDASGKKKRHDGLWPRLVRKTLWPLLVIEGCFALACLVAGALVWFWTMQHAGTTLTLRWIVLAWLAGSLAILAIMLMLLRRRMQRWQRNIEKPLDRIGSLNQRITELLPWWLSDNPSIDAGEVGSAPLFSRLDNELDALESALSRVAVQPRLNALLDGLDCPALLTYEGGLVASNGALERLVGRSQGKLQGLRLDDVLIHDEPVADASLVRVRDSEGHWRLLRLAWSEDGLGHGLAVLFDESATQRHIQQVSLACEHARQDSQLKTRYLTSLRRELDAVLPAFGQWLDDAGAAHDPALRERFLGLMDLLDSISDTRDAGMPCDSSADRPARVLIVDDGPVNAALAHSVLTRRGLQVDTARGGEEALELADRYFYDLVFMDIFMPTPDGIETSRRWRKREASTQRTRRSVLIALTANASEADREGFFAADMDDYLAKPYRPQALVDMIQRWLPKARIESAS